MFLSEMGLVRFTDSHFCSKGYWSWGGGVFGLWDGIFSDAEESRSGVGASFSFFFKPTLGDFWV